MPSEADFLALGITLKLAVVSTVLLLLLGTPLAWWMARSRSRFKFLVEAVVALPLVLPPTVLGFYLLLALGSNGPIGKLFESLGGSSLAFTFTGLVIGSVIYSLEHKLHWATSLLAIPWQKSISQNAVSFGSATQL